MEKQCAGCGKVFDDGTAGSVTPRPYGCCDDCNKASFKHQVHKFEGGVCTICMLSEEDHKAFLASQANKPPANPLPPPSTDTVTKKVVASAKGS